MTATVQYYKYPRTPHWRHELTRLGEDGNGIWLGAAVGAVLQRGDEPPVTMQRSFVQLIAPDVWWSAIFNDPVDTEMAIYVDVTTVPHWTGPDHVEMVDLDLDVVKLHDGTIYVDDEDEFEEHQLTLGYPPRIVDGARTSAARLVTDLEAGRPPFDGVADRWLDEVAVLQP